MSPETLNASTLGQRASDIIQENCDMAREICRIKTIEYRNGAELGVEGRGSGGA